uniref:Pyruvate kinase n=1 Tax=Dermatophagoides pteronyssinus TaxID=6956 RepID=A0A6P6YDS4_DERPT|nr:pyruvate kinase-like [Dermatophagoides pteronyssinus]
MSLLRSRGLKVTLDQIVQIEENYNHLRKTKIVCTLGPACWDVDKLVDMIDAGMDVCRFNFSHGDHKSHTQTLNNLKQAMKQRPNKKIALMYDTKGPEIRTGYFKEGVKSITLKKNNKLRVTTDYSFRGDENCIACTYKGLPTSVKVGQNIMIADGSLMLEIVALGENYVDTIIMNDATIGETKNMNLPGVKVDLPVCGEREINDIINFAIPNAIHSIAVSFVQCAQDVIAVREVYKKNGMDVLIIPKIENLEGVLNIDEIIAVSDGIMVARGDLGMEIPLEKVFLAQKLMIEKCNLAGKFVIVATQLLESMIKAPRPTRAEISDVANAVLDGTDLVMLSGESANGLFPTRAVDYLSRAAYEAEKCCDYVRLFNDMLESKAIKNPTEAICANAVRLAYDIQAEGFIVFTESGIAAKLLSKFRPAQAIIAYTNCEYTANSLMYYRCVQPSVFEFKDKKSDIKAAIKIAQEQNLIPTKGSVIVLYSLDKTAPEEMSIMEVVDL